MKPAEALFEIFKTLSHREQQRFGSLLEQHQADQEIKTNTPEPTLEEMLTQKILRLPKIPCKA